MECSRVGFSLLECMIVLALLMILAQAAMFNCSCVSSMVTHADITGLYMACLYMQRLAQVTQKTHYLALDTTGHAYTFDGKAVALSRGIHFGSLPSVKGPPSSPHALITDPVTFKEHRIGFMPHGITHSGTMYLTDARGTLYAISAPIARIAYFRLYRYDAGLWRLLR